VLTPNSGRFFLAAGRDKAGQGIFLGTGHSKTAATRARISALRSFRSFASFARSFAHSLIRSLSLSCVAVTCVIGSQTVTATRSLSLFAFMLVSGTGMSGGMIRACLVVVGRSPTARSTAVPAVCCWLSVCRVRCGWCAMGRWRTVRIMTPRCRRMCMCRGRGVVGWCRRVWRVSTCRAGCCGRRWGGVGVGVG
jgi:hypothetical protein